MPAESSTQSAGAGAGAQLQPHGVAVSASSAPTPHCSAVPRVTFASHCPPLLMGCQSCASAAGASSNNGSSASWRPGTIGFMAGKLF